MIDSMKFWAAKFLVECALFVASCVFLCALVWWLERPAKKKEPTP